MQFSGTQVMHWLWVSVVLLIFATMLNEMWPEITFARAIQVIQIEKKWNLLLWFIFCITPFLTLLSFKMEHKILLIGALVCNLLNLLYVPILLWEGYIYISERDSSMIALVFAPPAALMFASYFGARSTFKRYREKGYTA